MGSKIEYVDQSQLYATNYLRNSKGVAVLWAIFSLCYCIILGVAFLSPEWLADTTTSEYPARFGLWRYCMYTGSRGGTSEECHGRLDQLATIPGLYFQVATGLAGLAILLATLTILAILLFMFVTSTTVFTLCGWLQTVSGVSLMGSVCLYPLSWSSDLVRRTCGADSGHYALGDCSIRWAYLLAIIGCLDALILATLAFILATRHVKLQPEPIYTTNGSLYRGEVNGGFMGDGHSMAGSRKSLNLHPVLLMPQPGDMDRYSEFSNRTGRSKSSGFRAEYPSSMHNFQL